MYALPVSEMCPSPRIALGVGMCDVLAMFFFCEPSSLQTRDTHSICVVNLRPKRVAFFAVVLGFWQPPATPLSRAVTLAARKRASGYRTFDVSLTLRCFAGDGAAAAAATRCPVRVRK